VTPEEPPEHTTGRSTTHGAVFVVTLLFVLAAVSVSTGLVVYTAYLHDPVNGLFAVLFAVLSTRAALSWCLWRNSISAFQHFSNSANQQETRKPTDETSR
jgi:hypothetical protein